MAEEEVNYASVVFKSKNHPPTQARKEEETVDDEVKGQSKKTEETADTNAGVLLDKKSNNGRLQYQRLACCLGIFCVILLLGIIAVIVLYYPNENLRRDNNNLTVQLGNLTQNYTVLESKITNLTAEVQNLRAVNQQLEKQRKNLTEEIQNMETNWNKLIVSRAQWSIDAYCPKTKDVRVCKACLEGWLPKESKATNCYAYNDAKPPHQKTWEEAREDCRGKGSDLAVVHSQEEKTSLNTYSVGSSGTNGYWFGLRAEGGRWKWIDGSDLTVSYWTPQPPPTATDGQCVMSVKNVGWRSVSCTEKQRWICKMKALSV
ncbi:asialoglycoprotein receptor 1-like isoform X3 [Perca flavescens]|uniref:asialoglycoprotein receptor 1-like isoform X3 n=1 Tax=Perca flavescens TaxID=8167 RepID=UPI00106EFBAE|nr:asialoglycoprotein receptor 1-like isoform X3 [Perca flavescens]